MNFPLIANVVVFAVLLFALGKHAINSGAWPEKCWSVWRLAWYLVWRCS